jgi:signal transduction histidine kinase
MAAQAQIRCLARSGAKEAALAAIQHRFIGTGSRPGPGMDMSGRSITADEQLLALHLLGRGDTRYAATARRLAAWLNDYGVSMPSAQRLFLMSELRALAPDIAAFPTYAAEQLAAQFLESEPLRQGAPALESCRIRNLWRLASPDGGVIALYSGGSVVAALDGLLAEQNLQRNARFAVAPPGAADAGESIAAGPMLPGWQISFSLLNAQPFDEAARSRRAAYLWAGYLAVALIVLTGLAIGQSFRRQWRLARLKTDLVATVSHELKSPLASMRLLVDALLEEKELDPRKTREYLELIAGENLRLTRLIGNFLTFSRMERNRQRFDFALTKPSDVIQPALVAMRARLQSPGCCLEVDASPDLPTLHADRDALTTVLLNLLDNAYKYTPAEKRISLSAYSENGHVVFTVKDNGIGITPRDRKRIFRRFYQVDRRLTRETGGCGLGLSIVDFIVRAHGGTVDVESQPGAGSRFSVRIPYREATA